jgi:hypothetical protein
MAQKHRAAFATMYVTTPDAIAQRRNEQRGVEDRVPPAVAKSLAAAVSAQPPALSWENVPALLNQRTSLIFTLI